jgi:pimeloyl-ACP methyl ester carboxylesterase
VEYLEYTTKDCSVKEYYLRMSDGVQLRIIDFIPKSDNRKKPAIVFVAGWISLISGWKGVLRRITPKYRTLYIDTREKVTSRISDINTARFDMGRLSDDLAEIIGQSLAPDKNFFLAGSSFGATVIMEYLMHTKNKPLGAMLVAPICEFRYPPVLGNIVLAMPARFYAVIKQFVKWYVISRLDRKNEPEQVAKYRNTIDSADPYRLKRNAKAIRNFKNWEHLKKINTPLLVIGATTDTLHETDAQERMMNLLPRARYTTLASNKETHSEKAGDLMLSFIDRKEYLEL